MAKELMKKSFMGNFPGSELNNINNSAIENLLSNIIKKKTLKNPYKNKGAKL